MTNAMRKRLKHGLRWSDHRAPPPSVRQIAAAVFAALIVIIGYLFVSYKDAQAGMMEAQERQIKIEVAFVTLLNGDPVVLDKESGTVALAKVEVIGEPK
jgi:hypothetical protein